MAVEPRNERWLQRLRDFEKFLALFERTEATRRERGLNEAEEAGLVQFFEMTVEAGWKALGAFMDAEGVRLSNSSPLPVIREAAKLGLIDNADIWSVAVERRNRMSHTYDPDAFRVLIEDAGERFLPALRTLHQKLTAAAAS